MKFVRLLKISFVILTLFVLGELGYYVYVQKRGNGQENKIPKQQTKNLEIEPTLTIIQKMIDKPVQMTVNSTNELALSSKLLDKLFNSSKYIKKDVLKSYVVNVELEGEVIRLDIINKEIVDRYKVPNFIMVIKGPNGGTHQLAMQEGCCMQIHTLNIIDKQNATLTINDLKVGDKIRIKIEMDITESNSGQKKYNWLITKI